VTDTNDKKGAAGHHEHSRWQLFRDVLSFQFKLAIDGLRDILLSPISIGAALLGLASDSKDPGKYFYRLLKTGHHSDEWINLFGTHSDVGRDDVPSPDILVKHAQSLIVNEYNKGGVVQSIKDKTDSVIDKIQTTRSHTSKPDEQDEDAQG
jgi:hypothetical protein